MVRMVNANERRATAGHRPQRRASQALIHQARWQTVALWTSLVLLALCIIGFTLSLRSAGVIAGLDVPPAFVGERVEALAAASRGGADVVSIRAEANAEGATADGRRLF